MIVDFRAADCLAEITADLCVIGSGAAGITIARALAGSTTRVCVVESGGLEPDGDTQALYEGQSVGLPWGMDLATSRLRFFGGTTGHWGGGCVPLDASDMEPRPWVPHSGWPISRQDLDPFYDRARAVLHLPGYPFGDARLLSGLAHKPLGVDPEMLTNAYVLGSERPRFGEVYRQELARAGNVTVLLNANLLELEVNETGAVVQQALLRSLQGRTGCVRARVFVLACGGTENARLLLLSNSVQPQGLGNGRDLVGRFFMDHPSGKLGSIVSEDPDRLTSAYDRHLTDRNLPIYPQIALSRTLQQKQLVLNGRVRPEDLEQDVPDGISALRSLRGDLAKGSMDGLPSQILRVVADLGEVAPSIYRRLRGGPAVSTHRIDLEGFFEQAPNRHSRVSLGEKTDALGQREIRLDWQLTELDRHTYETAAKVFAAELARLGLGRVQFDPWLRPGGARFGGVGSVAHHMGTTRMSEDARTGVVDRNCRIHGVDNLYVAGSSVFPTGGWAFPTFTIVALALRLSDLLRQRLV
jgi:choline dehydrogenase-like flavoprotein